MDFDIPAREIHVDEVVPIRIAFLNERTGTLAEEDPFALWYSLLNSVCSLWGKFSDK